MTENTLCWKGDPQGDRLRAPPAKIQHTGIVTCFNVPLVSRDPRSAGYTSSAGGTKTISMFD